MLGGGSTQRPERVIGLHTLDPAEVIGLLEIGRGEKTSKMLIATSIAMARGIDEIVATKQELGAQHGDHWKPATLREQLAARGRRFSERDPVTNAAWSRAERLGAKAASGSAAPPANLVTS